MMPQIVGRAQSRRSRTALTSRRGLRIPPCRPPRDPHPAPLPGQRCAGHSWVARQHRFWTGSDSGGLARGRENRPCIRHHGSRRQSREPARCVLSTLTATWLSRRTGSVRANLRICRRSGRNAGSRGGALSLVLACRNFGIAQARPGMQRCRRFSGHRVARFGRHFAVRARQSPITGEYSRSGNCEKYRSPTLCGSRLSMSS